MPIPGVDYNLLIQVTRETRTQPEKLRKLGIEPEQAAGLTEALRLARQGQESHFLDNSDYVAQAYRILEVSPGLVQYGNLELPPPYAPSYERRAWARTTLEGLRSRAAESAWARRAAGSSGIFELPTAFLKGILSRNMPISPLDPSRMRILSLQHNPPREMLEISILRSAMVYAGFSDFANEDGHAFSFLVHAHRSPEYEPDPYTQKTLGEWHVLDDTGRINPAIGRIADEEFWALDSESFSTIEVRDPLKGIVLLRKLLHDQPEIFYALMEKYRNPNYRLDPEYESILKAGGLPLDPPRDSHHDFDVFDVLSLLHRGRFIAERSDSLFQPTGVPGGLSREQAGRVVLARRLEQLLRENGDAFIAVAVEALESTWDITLDYEEVLQRHGLLEPMGSRGRMGRFFLASSEELSVLSELYEGLYGKKMETAVQEAERKELTRLTHPVEAPHELGPYQLVLSKLETTIGGGDPSQGRNFAAEFRELMEAMDLFRRDSSQGQRFADAVTAFITAKLARRPSSEELALHLASDSERSVLRGLADIIDIMSAGRNERFVELVDRAREAGLFGTVDTRGGEGSRPRGSKKRKPKK